MSVIIHGQSDWVKVSDLKSFDAVRGEIRTEVWGGPYSTRESKYADLVNAGATSVSPQKAGAYCYLTAIYTTASQSGGGGGGAIEPITIRWDTDADITEIDLARIRTWAPDGSPLTTANKERARLIALVDQYVDKGEIQTIIDSTTLSDAQKTYGLLKAAGITGAMRAPYMINKTTTWASRADIDTYINYDLVWKVVSFGATGYPYKEPKYRDVTTAGAWVTVPMKWLTMPPRTSSQTRTHVLIQSWMGALEWKGDLYDNG
jgi:hypothetical protein